ncbi:acetylornithine deacetylase [Lutibacter profundi]|uniref:Acetylornithine deacetylase n=1 Tax=Lutibacter profundi TaxID=1622118 RepID=A0A109RN77_9FLAO|nr:M20/M25/M40 family metallo-hydrolase [Lutibacter profundi]AMC10572.1 acetylornithine deacetylase [Lutibacter profundi]
MKKLVIAYFILSVFSGFAQESTQLNTQLKKSIEELKDFVSIPNDALNENDIQQNITWLTTKFKARGFNTKVLSTEGLPLFFASLPIQENKPTVLFYMHFDGQSVDTSKWEQDNPYEIVLKKQSKNGWEKLDWSELNKTVNYDWRLFGRSTSDDKGPIVMLLNAIDLLKKNNKKIPFNVKVILDSEEEKSSKPLPKAVAENRALLNADFLIINDGPVHPSKKPTLVFGCRGITTLTLTTYGPITPQHSGHYGNYAPNPVFKMAHLLSSMKDTNGKVIINGYYDGIAIDKATERILKSVPDDIVTLHNTLAIKSPETVGHFYQESLQYPSLNVRGISSGWVGKKSRTIVPNKATAEIDIRLVPETDGNNLKNLIKKHIKNKGYYITSNEPTLDERKKYANIITIKEGSVTKPFRTDLNNPYGVWIDNILKSTFKKDVVKIRIMGGTVPISPFINELKIPAFIVPLVNPDNNQHSPNENLEIGQIAYGIQTFYAILSSPIN